MKRYLQLFSKYWGWEIFFLGVMFLAARSAGIRINREEYTYYTGFYGSVFLAAGILLLLKLGFRVFKTSPKRQGNVLTFTITSFILLFLVEIGLRGIGHNDTYGEQNGNDYFVSESLIENRDSWYFTYTPGEERRFEKSEFVYYREVNSFGFPEKELPLEKQANEFRILALGDSFTEGDGTAYDSSWVKVVERNMQADFPDQMITTFNAGIGGSDVVYQTKLLEDKLLSLQPDVILVGINSSDISDLATRGGPERFQPDGTVKIVDPHSWEWIYGISYTFRTFIHAVGYSSRLNHDEKFDKALTPGLIVKTLSRMNDLAGSVQAGFLVFIHPVKPDLLDQAYHDPEMEVLLDSLDEASFSSVDLLPQFCASGLCREEQIDEILWPVNLHFNAEGYRFFGEFVYREMDERKLVPSGVQADERVDPNSLP